MELTKTIGNKEIRCISLTTNNFQGGCVFYLIEIGAETDPNKFLYKLDEGWYNSAYPIEEARRNVEEIIRYMPYSCYVIETLNMLEVDYFKPRNHKKKLQEVNKGLDGDKERMDLYFFPDFMDKELSVIRFKHSINESHNNSNLDYYFLEIIDNGDKKYINLFDYPAEDEEYANLRIDRYIAYYNQHNPWGGKINTAIIPGNIELCDFLETHPLYTHQYLYRGLAYIEPYYDIESSI